MSSMIVIWCVLEYYMFFRDSQTDVSDWIVTWGCKKEFYAFTVFLTGAGLSNLISKTQLYDMF